MIARLIAATLLVAASPALAQESGAELWQNAAGGKRPKAIDITAPAAAGALKFRYVVTFSPTGTDVAAEYKSDDGELIGTLYIYRPPIASAQDTMIATTETIRAIYGAAVTIDPETLVDAGGAVRVAHRRAFDHLIFAGPNSQLPPGELASVLSVLQADDWLIKLRVTGPSRRKAEVAAAADAMLAAVRLGRAVKAAPAALDTVSDCLDTPATPDATALTVKPDERMAAAMSVIGALARVDAKNPPLPRQLCVLRRNYDGPGGHIVLRDQSGPMSPNLMLMGDSGAMVTSAAFFPGTKGSFIWVASGDKVQMFGPFDRPPSLAQLDGVMSGNTGWIGGAISSLTRTDPKGNYTVNISTN